MDSGYQGDESKFETKKKKKKLKLYGYKLQFNQSFLGKSALTSLKVFCYHIYSPPQ